MAEIKNVAIIMDGNGRWANSRFKPRVWGHIRGSKIVSDIVEAASDHGLNSLTLYAFSTENWSRPLTEINTLFKLLEKYLLKERPRILANNIKFKVIGDIRKLPESTQVLIKDLESESHDHNGLKLNFAFSYGGRKEIVNSVNQFILDHKNCLITESELSDYLGVREDIDLLIRTGGDHRISNFLLWQAAYAELYFTDEKWPEFTKDRFLSIIDEVSGVERRFGALESNSYFNSQTLAKKNLKEISYE